MIVVTGATGNVGGQLVRALDRDGAKVTGVSRHPADGLRHVIADLAEPESLRPALDGADALFLLVAGSGEGLDPRAIVDVVKRADVPRIVLLSSQGAGTRPNVRSHARLRAFEEAVRESDLDWTVLRPGGFMSNALAWAGSVRAQRTVAAPFGDVGLPVVDPADIAEVAAAVLLEPGHAGRTYELTGPAFVTPRQQAEVLGAALGEPVQFVQLTRDQAREGMLQFMPEAVVDGTLDILGEPLDAERQVSSDVQRLLGRTPGTFADWAARNVAAFR